ncbi:LAME_0E03488g1_1 [Lachancea meyersii CBS 8951]|uniref:LAME_0E03488g1_1 n=1 Tax=Lachancea meyersii CBS 8951 TaxID=1266667 RepID=A0A1G4JGR2_9SACH|nr:LAME_0E03488g1_1 [Lachancea meyersii CBS 8951]
MSASRVYALGSSPSVYLMCHEIASLSFQPRVPELVLLLQDQKKLNRFLDNESRLVIEKPKGGYKGSHQYMASCSPPKFASGEVAKVDNLIVGEKKPRSFAQALKKYSESIHTDTNVLLLNPTVGLVDVLRKKVWQERGMCPNLFIGMTNERHISRPSEFTAQLSSYKNSLQICAVPKTHNNYSYEQDVQNAKEMANTNNLLRLFKSVNEEESGSVLGVMNRSYGDLLLYRYEELIIQSCVLPITALYGLRFHDLKASHDLLKMVRALIAEFTHTIKTTDKFVSQIPPAEGALNNDRLVASVSRALNRDRRRILNEMNVHDINQFNGFFALKARKHNIKCLFNDTVMTCAKAKLSLTRQAKLDYRSL